VTVRTGGDSLRDASVATILRSIGVGSDVGTVVLVEGVSDQAAVETLADRLGHGLEAQGAVVVPTGGATNFARYLRILGAPEHGLRLAGLCDAGEERFVRGGLRRAGLGADLTREEMEQVGFYVCVDDLEDELIRALGPAEVERIIEGQRDLPKLRTFQNQPDQRDRPIARQLHRYMGTTSGRKQRYARVLVEHMDLARVPRPLDGLLAYVFPPGRVRRHP
jgi:hypothetical protein